MIFIDSNIPMYLVGAAHPNKDAARRQLEPAIIEGERLVTDSEVFQELLHRLRAPWRLTSFRIAVPLGRPGQKRSGRIRWPR